MRLSYNNDEFIVTAAGGRESMLLMLELFCARVEAAEGLLVDYEGVDE